MEQFIYLITEKKYLNEDQKDRLSFLCYNDGEMWNAFLNKKGTVVLCKLEDSGLIVAWSFIYETEDIPIFNIYVSKSYRKLGIGRQIFKISYDMFGDMSVSRWSVGSRAFFDKMGCNY